MLISQVVSLKILISQFQFKKIDFHSLSKKERKKEIKKKDTTTEAVFLELTLFGFIVLLLVFINERKSEFFCFVIRKEV